MRRIWILWAWITWDRPRWHVCSSHADHAEAVRARAIWCAGPNGWRTRLTSVLVPVPVPLKQKRVKP